MNAENSGPATLQNIIFSALCLAPLTLGWHALSATWSLALKEDAYGHILLILPISVTLIVLAWRKDSSKPTPSPIAGLALLSLAIAIAAASVLGARIGHSPADVTLSLAMLSIVVWWTGSFVGCFGTHIFRICIFPLLFLLFLVPLPRFATNYIVEMLQLGTASCARLLFAIIGIPALQDHTVVAIPGLTMEVAEQCSSIRSTAMLVVSATVVSCLLLRSGWHRSIVILAALPLSVARNGVRIVVLAVLGQYVDRGFLTGWLHHNGGPLFFAASLLVILGLVWLFFWIENKRSGLRLPKRMYQVASPRLAD